MSQPEKCIGHQDLEFAIEHEESVKEVLLGPEELQLHHPLAGIFERQKNIVDMDDHAGSDARENPEIEIGHVSPGFHGVGGIDEQDVIRAKALECLERDILNVGPDEL